MDGERFDDLARALARQTSRRGALKGLAGGALAALAAGLGRGGAGANHLCRHHLSRCRRDGQCCSRLCKKRPGATFGRCLCPRRRPKECGPEACCTATELCEGDTCVPCRAVREACATPHQCCAADRTTCAPNSIAGSACCRPLGGACTAGGPNGDCCMVGVPSGSDFAYCSAGGVCGGSGAACRFNEACVSGTCTGATGGGVGTCA